MLQWRQLHCTGAAVEPATPTGAVVEPATPTGAAVQAATPTEAAVEPATLHKSCSGGSYTHRGCSGGSYNHGGCSGGSYTAQGLQWSQLHCTGAAVVHTLQRDCSGNDCINDATETNTHRREYTTTAIGRCVAYNNHPRYKNNFIVVAVYMITLAVAVYIISLLVSGYIN